MSTAEVIKQRDSMDNEIEAKSSLGLVNKVTALTNVHRRGHFP
jgi:hypothetical protein